MGCRGELAMGGGARGPVRLVRADPVRVGGGASLCTGRGGKSAGAGEVGLAYLLFFFLFHMGGASGGMCEGPVSRRTCAPDVWVLARPLKVQHIYLCFSFL